MSVHAHKLRKPTYTELKRIKAARDAGIRAGDTSGTSYAAVARRMGVNPHTIVRWIEDCSFVPVVVPEEIIECSTAQWNYIGDGSRVKKEMKEES